eukprot:TRINITY_DN3338_c0_g3_i1.p1 TRINITY_DN3338_c0_g3~~TRINITY_DN3338_c0_g3_i1.p1  ORF type:complete len:392 (-),score=45.38 TRINITY_DN3338_c0_g3_i1:360-1535(-)
MASVIEELPEAQDPDIRGYAIRAILGNGRSGTVYQAIRDVRSSSNADDEVNEFAIKVYSSDGDRGNVYHYGKEVHFLRLVQGHPNVGTLCACLDSPLAIVMPLYQSDLFTFVHASNGLSESSAAHIMRGVLRAVQHIHEREVLHRDIKPENIATHGPDNEAILLDFDIACSTSNTIATKETCGTPGYMAPEVVMGATYGTIADLFSVGGVMYFMFGRRGPFEKRPFSRKATYRRTLLRECSFDALFDAVGFACKQLILLLLAKKSAQRLSAGEALQHYWLVEEKAALSIKNSVHFSSGGATDGQTKCTRQLVHEESASAHCDGSLVASTDVRSSRLTRSRNASSCNASTSGGPTVADPVDAAVMPPDEARRGVPRRCLSCSGRRIQSRLPV